MSIQEKYCPLTDMCNKYPNCFLFCNSKWLECLVYKKLQSWICQIIPDENLIDNEYVEMEEPT